MLETFDLFSDLINVHCVYIEKNIFLSSVFYIWKLNLMEIFR